MAVAGNLPEDMMGNILQRLPVKSLSRFSQRREAALIFHQNPVARNFSTKFHRDPFESLLQALKSFKGNRLRTSSQVNRSGISPSAHFLDKF